LSSESERIAFWNEIFSPEAEGVRVSPGPATGQLTIDYIENHSVHGIVHEGDSYFDWVLRNALQSMHGERLRQAQKIVELEEQVAQLRQMVFGTSSEQMPSGTETSQPEPVADLDSAAAADPKVVDLSKERAARNAGRKPLPDHLPRELHIHDASSCPCCQGKSLHMIGEEATEQLTVEPARFKVLRHLRKKYRCKSCEKVFTAAGPKHLIEKSSYASPEFLAYVACSKYQYGLPFYRQEAIFNQAGLPVNRTTLANLMMGTADKFLALYAVLREALLKQDAIHADETNIQVLKEPGRKATTKSWLWLYRSREAEPHQVVLFEYQQTRAGEHPRRFLDIDGPLAFKGFLQVDGYGGYNNLSGLTRVGCMTHVRRKFAAIVKPLPSQACNTPAHHALELIGKLYGIERRINGSSDRIRYRVRQQESVPILDELKAWLDEMQPKVTPKGELGKAIGYALDQWAAVRRYVDDGRLAIDNNIAEREIKAVVIGRKNWLFADSVDGAHTNAVMYSLVQTAKANGLDPFDYLRYVIETLPKLRTAAEIHVLLPWNMPGSCHAEDCIAA
jgi:transposase